MQLEDYTEYEAGLFDLGDLAYREIELSPPQADALYMHLSNEARSESASTVALAWSLVKVLAR